MLTEEQKIELRYKCLKIALKENSSLNILVRAKELYKFVIKEQKKERKSYERELHEDLPDAERPIPFMGD